MGNIGIWQLLIIAVIIILLFGTKKLKGLGGDLGGAIKGFKKAIKDEEANEPKTLAEQQTANQQKTEAEKAKDKA
ncbi:twin-arginine translocase TatA/TatE family subunit [Paraferrimonas sp. SM1919]|uniref:twin-arginine translocase TatA/TatE family subunit n=1 Tax=Paraferrimonas sp. SM1919 TaxID=2662263 RepID=UPI0013D5B73C|nr:twin-arginine translocase TatA/TatE family subunit [Paraferrimonas sp. SM1919]